jgi:integrase
MKTTNDTSRIATHFRFTKARLLETRDRFLTESSKNQLDCYDTDAKGLIAVLYRHGAIDFRSRLQLGAERPSFRHGGLSPLLSVEQARLANAALRLQIAQGVDPRDAQRAGIKFGEFFSAQFVPHNRNKRSLKDDKQKFDLRLNAHFGHLPLASIRQPDLVEFLRKLEDEEKLAPATVNRYLALLKAIFRLAAENDVLPKSPAKYLKPLLERNIRTRTLREEERQMFVAACKAEAGPSGTFLLLLALTGARLGELLSAKVEHVDMSASSLFLPMTKAGKADHIFLSRDAAAILRDVIGKRQSGYLFPGKESSKPMSRPAKAFARICKHAGIENLHIHDLRRSWATTAINNGVPIHTVATALRHASSHMTAKRYAFLQDKALIEAHELVGRLMCREGAGVDS